MCHQTGQLPTKSHLLPASSCLRGLHAALLAQPVCCPSCCASPLQPPDDLLSAGQPLLLRRALHTCRGLICQGGSCQLVQKPVPQSLLQGLQLGSVQLLCLQQGSSQVLWAWAAVPEHACRNRMSIPHNEGTAQDMHLRQSARSWVICCCPVICLQRLQGTGKQSARRLQPPTAQLQLDPGSLYMFAQLTEVHPCRARAAL